MKTLFIFSLALTFYSSNALAVGGTVDFLPKGTLTLTFKDKPGSKELKKGDTVPAGGTVALDG